MTKHMEELIDDLIYNSGGKYVKGKIIDKDVNSVFEWTFTIDKNKYKVTLENI